MARVAARKAVVVTGIREYLRDKALAGDDQRLMDALAVGGPVRVPGWMLPLAVRLSAEYRQATAGTGRFGNPITRPVMATVFPDGRVVYGVETGADWLAEHMPEDDDRP
mgnify:CR=1 FL=1